MSSTDKLEDMKKIFGPDRGVLVMGEGAGVYLKTECHYNVIQTISKVTMVLSAITALMTIIIIWRLK